MENFQDAHLLMLDRDTAKQFFGFRDDEQRLAYLNDLKATAESVDLGAHWPTLHRCLGDGSLDANACVPPLGDALLGGRQMHQGPDAIVSMLRPDMVPVVAEALAAKDQDWLRERCNSLQLPCDDALFANLSATTQLYQTAAAGRAAVVFFAS